MRTLRSVRDTMALASCFSLLAVSFICTPTHAVIITLEPDDYAVGTDVSKLLEGATLTRFNSNVAYSNVSRTEVVLRDPTHPFVYSSPVYVEEVNRSDFRAATGTQSLGNFGLTWPSSPIPVHAQCWFGTGPWCNSYSVYDDPFYALVIQFDQPTNYVEFAGSQWSVNFLPVYDAYDSTGQRLTGIIDESQTRGMDDLGGLRISYQLGNLEGAQLIQTVFIGGQSAMGNVDRISYNSVPEPSSLLLLSVGLAGVAAWRRRQRL